MEQKFDNAMRRQVYSIPELITQQYDLMEPRIREALSFQEIFSLQHIIITGCGDSMAAAMAVKQAFEQTDAVRHAGGAGEGEADGFRHDAFRCS